MKSSSCGLVRPSASSTHLLENTPSDPDLPAQQPHVDPKRQNQKLPNTSRNKQPSPTMQAMYHSERASSLPRDVPHPVPFPGATTPHTWCHWLTPSPTPSPRQPVHLARSLLLHVIHREKRTRPEHNHDCPVRSRAYPLKRTSTIQRATVVKIGSGTKLVFLLEASIFFSVPGKRCCMSRSVKLYPYLSSQYLKET